MDERIYKNTRTQKGRQSAGRVIAYDREINWGRMELNLMGQRFFTELHRLDLIG
jgi:hypothetical protein